IVTGNAGFIPNTVSVKHKKTNNKTVNLFIAYPPFGTIMSNKFNNIYAYNLYKYILVIPNFVNIAHSIFKELSHKVNIYFKRIV
ncbi:hypothetical protein DEO01_26580, partial [Escherichia coli]